eukprot:7325425-Prymnesium_polylepis.1
MVDAGGAMYTELAAITNAGQGETSAAAASGAQAGTSAIGGRKRKRKGKCGRVNCSLPEFHSCPHENEL